MKLSEVVAYLNLLDTLSIEQESAEAIRRLSAVLHVVVNHDLKFGGNHSDLQQNFNSIQNNLGEFQATLDRLKEDLRQEIERQEPEYFRESMRRYEHETPFESYDYILDRRLPCDSDSDIKLRSKLRSLADWRLPGMIIRPGKENFVEDLVPLDPLYLVDQDERLLKTAVFKFTPEYQRRLREYVVNDRQPGKIMEALPDNQFGFVFAYNFFNHRPMELISRYLAELNEKLRPGGTIIMTYNNCDLSHGVALAERSWMMYTPRRAIITQAENVGLEHVGSHDGLGDLSWLEFRKPGEITTLRGGQTLAKILAST